MWKEVGDAIFCGEFEKDNLILALVKCVRHWIFRFKRPDVYKFANERSNILDENLKIYRWTYTIVWNVSADRSCHRFQWQSYWKAARIGHSRAFTEGSPGRIFGRYSFKYLSKREYSQKVRNGRFSIDELTRFSETSRKKEIAIAFNEREHLRTYSFEEKRIWIRALNMKI